MFTERSCVYRCNMKKKSSPIYLSIPLDNCRYIVEFRQYTLHDWHTDGRHSRQCSVHSLFHWILIMSICDTSYTNITSPTVTIQAVALRLQLLHCLWLSHENNVYFITISLMEYKLQLNSYRRIRCIFGYFIDINKHGKQTKYTLLIFKMYACIKTQDYISLFTARLFQ